MNASPVQLAFAQLASIAVRVSVVVFGFLALLATLHTLTAGPAAVIAVRWQPDASPEVRRDLESRFLLTNAERRGPVNWAYDLLDTSTSNIEALVRHPRVADTHGVNRESFEPNDEPSDTTRTSALSRLPGLRNPARRANLILALAVVALPGGLLLLFRFLVWALGALAVGMRSPRWQFGPDEVAWRQVVAATAAVGIVTAIIRFLTLEMRLPGDDHAALYMASAVLKGAAPYVDVFDPGVPLYWWLSALGQWVSGYRLAGEVAVSIVPEAIGFAVAFVLTWKVSRSPATAAAMLTLSLMLLLATKLHSYPKLFLYPMVFALIWRYVARPTRARLLVLGVGVAVAFLFRPDHGLYTGIAALTAIVLREGRSQIGAAVRSVAMLAVFILLVLSPWFAWIASTEGVIEYFRSRIDYSREAGIAAARPPLGLRAVGTTAWAAIPPLDPVQVDVAWTGLDDAARADRERLYELVPAGPAQDDIRRYDLRNTSLANVEALVRDPHVESLGGLDPLSATPAGEGGLLGRWRRQIALLRVQFFPGYVQPQNAGPWLYTVFAFLPLAALTLLGFEAWRGRPERFPHERTIVATGVVLLVLAELGLMRRMGSFCDLATLGSVVAGWLVSVVWVRRDPVASSPRPRRLAEGAMAVAAAALVLVTATAAASFVRLPTYFEAYAQNDAGYALAALRQRVVDLAHAFVTVPPIEVYAPAGAPGDGLLIRYFRDCTRPDDAIWDVGGNFAWPYYAERLVVQHPYWSFGFRRSEENQQEALKWVSQRRVPIVYDKEGVRPLQWVERYSLVHQYLSKRYRDVSTPALRELFAADHKNVWILVDRTLEPTGTYPALGLPCFR